LLARHLGLPVSKTHAIAGSLVGVGAVQRVKAVRWVLRRYSLGLDTDDSGISVGGADCFCTYPAG